MGRPTGNDGDVLVRPDLRGSSDVSSVLAPTHLANQRGLHLSLVPFHDAPSTNLKALVLLSPGIETDALAPPWERCVGASTLDAPMNLAD